MTQTKLPFSDCICTKQSVFFSPTWRHIPPKVVLFWHLLVLSTSKSTNSKNSCNTEERCIGAYSHKVIGLTDCSEADLLWNGITEIRMRNAFCLCDICIDSFKIFHYFLSKWGNIMNRPLTTTVTVPGLKKANYHSETFGQQKYEMLCTNI